jgi:hypothetical protein
MIFDLINRLNLSNHLKMIGTHVTRYGFERSLARHAVALVPWNEGNA